MSQHPAILQPRERPQQGQLEPFRETRAKTLNVNLRGRQALRLEEDLVPVLILEAHNLILNRGTVPFRGKESLGQSVECPPSVECSEWGFVQGRRQSGELTSGLCL